MSFRTSATVAASIILVVSLILIAQSSVWGTIGALSLANPLQFAELSTTSTRQLSAVGVATQVDLPILVYHVVRPSDPSDSAEVRSLAQAPEVFGAQMDHLKKAGYQVVRFSDLKNYLTNAVPLARNPIILSFDDGWASQYTYAFPILKKHNYPATFFIFSNSIGHRNFLSLDNLREMIAAGMTVGSHSRSHPYLAKITDEHLLREEIEGSKRILEKMLGVLPLRAVQYTHRRAR